MIPRQAGERGEASINPLSRHGPEICKLAMALTRPDVDACKDLTKVAGGLGGREEEEELGKGREGREGGARFIAALLMIFLEGHVTVLITKTKVI